MSETNGFAPALPATLVNALESAIAKNLGALDSLKKTLRMHVRTERNRGATLAEIDRDLARLLAGAEQRPQRGSAAGGFDDLGVQISKWSAAFFNGRN
jgi:hypothetical protein